MSTPQALPADLVKEFVIAGHWNLDKVKEMLASHPQLLNVANEWSSGDRETAIMAAAHAGSAHVAEYLLGQGAPLEICTAAMLGRRQDVERMLTADPSLIQAKGAHGIPLLTHAAFSGDPDLVRALYARGARQGVSAALSNAVSKGHVPMVRWLLESAAPDLAWQNFQGKTALAIAQERGDEEITSLLRAHGAKA